MGECAPSNRWSKSIDWRVMFLAYSNKVFDSNDRAVTIFNLKITVYPKYVTNKAIADQLER